MFVKICGITNPEDGLLAAGLGADAIGLIFSASQRRVSQSKAIEIVEKLPNDVLCVGVFRNELKERVVEIADNVGLGAVQLHGNESVAETKWINERVPSLIRAFSVEELATINIGDYDPCRLLVDSPKPGSGETFDWVKFRAILSGREFLLAGGLTPSNVANAIETLSPWGVDVASGVESEPGIKDPRKVRKFITNAKAATP